VKLIPKKAPHIRSDVSNKTVMGDAVLTLAALYFMAMCYYGQRALSLGLLSVAVCWGADALCVVLRGRRVNLRDFSPVVTGMIIPLMMPANIPYYVVVTAGLFAILVVKQPFGGLGSNIFNPAAGGIAFATVCWSSLMFSYPLPSSGINFFGNVSQVVSSSTAYTLYVGGVPMEDATSVLLGQLAGPMGATSVLVIWACLLYLLFRGTVRYQQSLLLLLTMGVLNFLFPRVAADGLTSAFYEVMATPVLFCAAFMFTDPVTSPSRNMGKALYGLVGGIVMFLFSRFGGYEQTTVFALLLMNAVSPAFDAVAEWDITKKRRMQYGRKVSIDLSEGEDFGADEGIPPVQPGEAR
jgi:electron transport complex protein RnfD